MPGRKKGRQRRGAGSKSQSARKWNDTLRDAREELAADKKTKLVCSRDTAPPRLSAQGFRSLATLLHQRVRADQLQQVGSEGRGTGQTPGSSTAPGQGASSAGTARGESYFSTEWIDCHPPRRTRSLLSLCISQIGRDFLAYRTDDDAVAQAFLLLPARCVSRISRVASARATITDHNIGLLCSPGIASLWLRGRFTDEGASALLPVLRGGILTDRKHLSGVSVAELVETYREDVEGGSQRGGDDELVGGEASAVPARGEGEGETEGPEEWETADDRMEACLQGGVSITSLDISSPLLTSRFVERLVLRIPTLRRLGLRGSLGVVGGPDTVCDYVPRLTALRELDVSHCTWFCDLCLRRFVKTMWRRLSSTALNEIAGHDRRDSHWMIAMAQDEGTANWGAASAPANGLDPSLHIQAGALGSGERWPGDVRTTVAGVRGRVGGGEVNVEQTVRFRAFTLTCARTAVTEKGARTAESMSPGLLVVREDSPLHTNMLNV